MKTNSHSFSWISVLEKEIWIWASLWFQTTIVQTFLFGYVIQLDLLVQTITKLNVRLNAGVSTSLPPCVFCLKLFRNDFLVPVMSISNLVCVWMYVCVSAYLCVCVYECVVHACVCVCVIHSPKGWSYAALTVPSQSPPRKKLELSSQLVGAAGTSHTTNPNPLCFMGD